MTRIAVLFGLAALFAVPAFAASTDAQVKIVNRSLWDIHYLYISPVDDEEWGPDQLGDDVIESGESFTLREIPCDAYDVKIVDEDDDECVVAAVVLCAGKDHWVIENDALLECQNAE